MRPGSSQSASQIDRPRPSASPSIWNADVAAPHTKPGGHAGVRRAARPSRSSRTMRASLAQRAPNARVTGPRRAAPCTGDPGAARPGCANLAKSAYPVVVSEVVLGMPGTRLVRPVRPSSDPRLVDRFGRVATDLRVSLTDRCTLRCSYCMPPEGLDWLPGPDVLTDAEVMRLIRIAVEDLAVDEVRFTGGEPLLRRGLEDIVAATTALRTASGEPPSTALTTNAVGLEHRAARLAEAGLQRVNVSLDTLDPA